MFRRILVPLDGSATSAQALPFASEIAARSKAELRLVHVHEPIRQVYVNDLAIGEIPTEGTPLDDQVKANEAAYLDAVRERLADSGQLSSAVIPHHGGVAAAIAREARESRSELIVMTTHGQRGFSRLWLGSAAEGVLRATSTPVLLVRPDPMGVAAPAIRQILVPIASDEAADLILAPAMALARLYGAAITFLAALDPTPLRGFPFGGNPEGPMSGLLRAEEEAAHRRVEALAAACAAEGVAASGAVVMGASPAAAILGHLESTPTDLIAMLTHARGRVRRLVFGSVADKVLRGAGLPIMLVHPQEEREETPDA